MADLIHAFAGASGTGFNDCHWLAYRYREPPGFRPESAESWVGVSKEGTSYTLMDFVGWMTGLWRTDSKVWVCDSSGRVFENPISEKQPKPWAKHQVGGMLSGIWGLRDDLVFAWGRTEGRPVAFVHRGKEWQRVDLPGYVQNIRGVSEELIYAVGLKGLICRWNGSGFAKIDGPTAEHLRDVFVVSGSEMYACGTGGSLLQCSGDGWAVAHRHSGPLDCVAKWKDSLWLGSAAEGLYQFVDGKLLLRKDNVKAERFDVRQNLLMSTRGVLVHSLDGEKFRGNFVKTFESLTAKFRFEGR